MRADRSPSTQSSPMTMGCDRQGHMLHVSKAVGSTHTIAVFYYSTTLFLTGAAHLKGVALCLAVMGEEVDARSYKCAVSNGQQVGLRATLAKPAHTFLPTRTPKSRSTPL